MFARLPDIIVQIDSLTSFSQPQSKSRNKLAASIKEQLSSLSEDLTQSNPLHSKETERLESELKKFIPVLTKQSYEEQDPDIECIAARIACLLSTMHQNDNGSHFLYDMGEDGMQLLEQMIEMNDKENLLFLLKGENFNLSKLPGHYGERLLALTMTHFIEDDRIVIFDLLVQKGANPFGEMGSEGSAFEKIVKTQDEQLFNVCVRRRWKEIKKPDNLKILMEHPTLPFFKKVLGKMKANTKIKLFANDSNDWSALFENTVKNFDGSLFAYLLKQGVPLQNSNSPMGNNVLRKLIREPEYHLFLKLSLESLCPNKVGENIHKAAGHYLRESLDSNNLNAWRLLLEYGADLSLPAFERSSLLNQILAESKIDFLHSLMEFRPQVWPDALLNDIHHPRLKEIASLWMEGYGLRKAA